MNVLIVEDEINARKVIKYFLKEFFPEMIIAGEATSIAEAKQKIEQQNPDLVLLDVRLEDGTGIELLQQIENRNFELIFTTAYANYAIQAIKNEAIDYLLKPIDPNEFKLAITKAIHKINESKNKSEKSPKTEEKKTETIHIKTADATYYIPVNEIIHLEADGAYTTIITKQQKIVASKNLKYFEKYLSPDLFIRPHQSHIIHKTHILSLNNKGCLQLSNGECIPISVRKKAMIRKLLKNKN